MDPGMTDVFYRKWRPSSLSEIMGQTHVTTILHRAMSINHIAHAYLFCGPRGTGKTSTARILAKALNCTSPNNGEPDNQCDLCQSINEGTAMDLIEIDAASNRSIDGIREISEKIHFSPAIGKFKIYIIDEVHMLTEPAFNALLKTLEEPPSHAIFILATTEIHKVPATIISRCQRFDFRRITIDQIVEKLSSICEFEKIDASTEALRLIARHSNGGMRDAENLLEQLSVAFENNVSEESVRNFIGISEDKSTLELTSYILSGSVSEGLNAIHNIATSGEDMRMLKNSLLDFLRATMHLKVTSKSSLGYKEEIEAQLSSLADKTSMDQIIHSLKIFSTADVGSDGGTPLGLELAMVESAVAESPIKINSETPLISTPKSVISNPINQQKSPTTTSKPKNVTTSKSLKPDPEILENSKTNSEVDQPTPVTGNNENQNPTNDTAPIKDLAKTLRHEGKKFKLGGLLHSCKGYEINNDKITFKFAHRSNMERMQEELSDSRISKTFSEAIESLWKQNLSIELAVINETGEKNSVIGRQTSPLVRQLETMGARVVSKKEKMEETYDES